MLAIITHNGTSLVDPAKFKFSSGSFPISSSLVCSASAWSADNSQLYLANSSSIKRYTPSECLLEEIYCGSDTVTSLEMNVKTTTLFFAAANKVWSLDCAHTPEMVLSSLEPHKSTVTRMSISSDGSLLVSVSASAVFVHNLMLLSHTQLKGLPGGKTVSCCLFHQHSGKPLLGVGRDILVYESMRNSGPLKTVRVPGGGDIVSISNSPFSKTLVAAVTSNGDVALVDLDKDNGILKTVNVNIPLMCCAFTAEGAAIYLGTKDGKLLILDLRSLEKGPKSFTVGDGAAPIKAINVQGKSRVHFPETNRVRVKSSSAAVVRLSPRRPASSTRTGSTGSAIVGPGIKSPVRATIASKIRGGGGVTPKKKLFSPVRTPLSETQNLGLYAQLASSRSPTLSRHVKPLGLQRGTVQEENHKNQAQPLSPAPRESTEPANRQRTKSSSPHGIGQDVERLGLGPAPQSISGHLAAMRIRSGPSLNGNSRDAVERPKTTTRRIISESMESAPLGRKFRAISTGTAQSKVSSSKTVHGTVPKQQRQGRSATPDDSDGRVDLSDPELPREPVTPIPLGKNVVKVPSASTTGGGGGILGLTSPEIAKWVKGESQKGKGKEKVVEAKKIRFAQHPDTKEPSERSDELEDEGGVDGQQDEEREHELSLQVSPRRPTAPPTWLHSPHRPSAANLNMNAAAQDFLRGIVHDVMYDLQRETKAEMMGLHLDLVRMRRGWKQELREVMEEWNGEIRELKAENKRLREENERLRRFGY